MFYDRFKCLCDTKGVSCKKAVMDIGLSNSIATKWKKTGATPNGETLIKIAAYFDISVEELLGEEKKPVPEGNELNMETVINNMSREQLIEFIMLATARLKDIE